MATQYKWTNESEDAAFRAIFMSKIWNVLHELETLQRTSIEFAIDGWSAQEAKKEVYKLQDMLIKQFGKDARR